MYRMWGMVCEILFVQTCTSTQADTIMLEILRNFSPPLWCFSKGDYLYSHHLLSGKCESVLLHRSLHCTQAYKHGSGSQRCPPYRQEPKVPPVEMSLFPLGCHTMSTTLWSLLKALQAKAFTHSTHSTAKALTLARGAIKIVLRPTRIRAVTLAHMKRLLCAAKHASVIAASLKTNPSSAC